MSDLSIPPPADEQPEEFPQIVVLEPPKRPYWLHALLFILTIFTTMAVGARLQRNFLEGYPSIFIDSDFLGLRALWYHPKLIWTGLPFTCSLMGILLAHEMGHYVYALRHRVYATLPFFIPAPTPIGTFGAFIQIKSRFHSRAALFDMAIAGPIAGFLVAVPVALLGLALSRPLPVGYEPEMNLGHPLIFHGIFAMLQSIGLFDGVTLSRMLLHPIALGAWVGMLATALNLLPGGQLDGGHILFALSPSLHWRFTRYAMAALVPLAFFSWSGWLIWILGLYLTRRHPWVPDYPELDGRRKWLAAAALLMLVLTFSPAPVEQNSILDDIHQHFPAFMSRF